MLEGEACEVEETDDEFIASKWIFVRRSLKKIKIRSDFILFSIN